MLERVCPCGAGEVKTIEHVLLHCQFYQETRSKIIFCVLKSHPGYSDAEIFRLFLMGVNLQVTVLSARPQLLAKFPKKFYIPSQNFTSFSNLNISMFLYIVKQFIS